MALLEAFIILGTVAFAISGALVGIKKEMDLFGVLILCVITALGGGIIRDMLLGNSPPSAFVHPHYFLICLITGLLTWCFYQKIQQFEHIILISDAIGLGVFTAAGAKAAIAHQHEGLFIILAMGLLTGVGGGIVRDVCSKEIPSVFTKEVYGMASLAGGVSFYISYPHLPLLYTMYICLMVTFLIRVLSVQFNWQIPVLVIESDASASSQKKSSSRL